MGQTTGQEAKNHGWKRRRIAAAGGATVAVSGIGAGDVFGGVLMDTAGTSTTLTGYDAASADANNKLFPVTATLTVGQFVGPTGGVASVTAAPPLSGGILLRTGLTLVIGGTGNPVFWALFK